MTLLAGLIKNVILNADQHEVSASELKEYLEIPRRGTSFKEYVKTIKELVDLG